MRRAWEMLAALGLAVVSIATAVWCVVSLRRARDSRAPCAGLDDSFARETAKKIKDEIDHAYPDDPVSRRHAARDYARASLRDRK